MATFYRVSFTNVLTLTIPGTVHGLGTADLLYQLYTPAGDALQEGSWHVDPVTYTITLTFPAPQSGTLAVLPAVADTETPPTPSPGPTPPPGPVSAGHMEPALLAMLVDDVVQTPYLGQDQYGKPVYGAAFTRPARIEFATTVVSNTQGQERTSTTLLFLNGDLPITSRDKLTLPDGSAPAIQEIQAPRHPFRPATIHHYAVKL